MYRGKPHPISFETGVLTLSDFECALKTLSNETNNDFNWKGKNDARIQIVDSEKLEIFAIELNDDVNLNYNWTKFKKVEIRNCIF